MNDLKQHILEIAGPPQLANLATLTKDGKPWTRYVMTVADEDLAFRCATFVRARKVQHINANPEVHITCGCADPTAMKPYLQVQAKAELATDEATRHAFWSPMLEKIFAGPDDPKFGVLVMKAYRIELCSHGSPKPEVYEA